jgi:glyoxylase-like metal-dependent hydrolase (beta-lactamase superfamily II)
MRRAPSPISHRHDSLHDPLGDYLASVAKLRGLPVDTVLPGHGRPVGDLGGRLDEIERDFTAQLTRIRTKLAEGPASAYEILLRVQGVGDRREVALRYALSQVLSRLQHLVSVGDARRIPREDATIEFALA